MVLLHIKRGEISQFVYETSVGIDVAKLTQEIVAIYNGRLKIQRICAGWIIDGFFQRESFQSVYLQKWKSWPTTDACFHLK